MKPNTSSRCASAIFQSILRLGESVHLSKRTASPFSENVPGYLFVAATGGLAVVIYLAYGAFFEEASFPRSEQEAADGLAGIAWGDLDHDGRDDLVVGAGRGQAMATLRNTDVGFAPWTRGPELPGDQGGLAVVALWRSHRHGYVARDERRRNLG